jgi:hypothetical protein
MIGLQGALHVGLIVHASHTVDKNIFERQSGGTTARHISEPTPFCMISGGMIKLSACPDGPNPSRCAVHQMHALAEDASR